MVFEFTTAARILFGRGKLIEVGPIASGIGGKALVVLGNSPERAQPLFDELRTHSIDHVLFRIPSEPTTDIALAGVSFARQNRCSMVISIGGGSVIDSGKVIAALLTNAGDLFDYLEVIGEGHHLKSPSAPFIAIPTTSGTGTEVTYNSVLTSLAHKVKVSIRSPLMIARVAIVDPELTYSMPPPVTASTGLDAVTQLMESFVSNKANPLTDGICKEGLHRAGRSLFKAFRHGHDANAREDMSIASLFGGLALANAKLGAVHGFASVIGGMYSAPHGIICARLLPYVMEMNIRAIKRQIPHSTALHKYDDVAQIVTGNHTAKASDGIRWTQELCKELHTPSFHEMGLTKEDFPQIVAMAKRASSFKGNPIELTDAELLDILEQAF
jgi:alcohol dehydrogenase class IV